MRRSLSWTSISIVVVDLGPGEDRGERGLAARVRVEGADAHEAVDAGLRREVAVGVLALHHHGGALDPRLLPRLDVGDVALEAAAVAPAQVHAQQHLRPVLAVRAPGPGVDGQDRVRPVVVAAQHLLELGGLRGRLQGVEGGGEVGGHVLSRLQPVGEDLRVVLLAAEALQQLEVGVEALAALQDLLGGRGVAPEAGVGHLPIEGVGLGAELALLKDSRGCPRPSLAATRTAASGLRSTSSPPVHSSRPGGGTSRPRGPGRARRRPGRTRRRGACRRSSRPRTAPRARARCGRRGASPPAPGPTGPPPP